MSEPCLVAVLWIDWYAYHVARFRGMMDNPMLAGKVRGIELVGGVGVHQGLKFREDLPVGLPVETLMPGCSWAEAGQLTLARKVWQCLTRVDPEVVLVPGYYTLPAIAAAFWAKFNRRTSVLMTESTAEDHIRVWWKELLKSALIRMLFDWAICGGKAHVRYLDQLGFATDRIAHSYDVVDNRSLEQSVRILRQQTAARQGLPGRYFLYVGRLAPEKNVDGLLAAWSRYRQQGGTWPLVLVGDGPLANSLQATAKALPFASDVHFAGHKGSAELPPYYAFAGCFVLPSTREPWGLVVNEAMASGLPVIVSDRCGCVEDLVHPGGNGLIFNPLLDGSLPLCLQHIASMGDKERDEMGNKSQTIIRNYSPETFGREVGRIALNL